MKYSMLGIVVLWVGCAAEVPPVGQPCAPDQDAPYASGIPYLGIHAGPGNSDIVRCATAESFSPGWHALAGLGVMQPNTFSPDGATTYVTTTHPQAGGCRLHALDTRTGEVRWCSTWAGSVNRSAVEVDSDGHLYFSVASSVVSLEADGSSRWETALPDAAWGVHFTPAGHLATVTSSGTVHLVARSDGRMLASFDIAAEYGFVPPAPWPDIDVTSLFPQAVQDHIQAIWGTPGSQKDGPGFAEFLGTGEFVDNTLGVSSRGRIYVIGGGPGEEQGALVQLRIGGADDAPTLEPGWYTATHRGSATSPSVSPGDRFVMISDGAARENIQKPGTADARVKVMDIDACDANTDSDPDPGVCGVAYEERLQRGAIPGSPAIDADGTVVLYEFGLSFDWPAEDRDVAAFGPDGVLWEASLDGGMDWTSVITVTDNHLIGTATAVVPSEDSLFGLVFPATSADSLVVLDRRSGATVFTAPIPDDSAATVTVGPDGALYVGMLGLISILTIGEEPTLGLMRFAPER